MKMVIFKNISALLGFFTVFLPGELWAFNMGYHYDLIREVMVEEGFNKDAYSVALAANSYTDIFQEESMKYITDNDFAEKARKLVDFLHFDQIPNQDLINRYWRRLIYNTYHAIRQKMEENDELGLLMVIGITLHTVQDFYAHSNWIELDVPRFAGIKDATYFDVVVQNPGAISTAVLTNYTTHLTPFERYPYEKSYSPDLKEGFFTHGNDEVQKPPHYFLHKDDAARAHFDWAYRCAYKASLEWLKLIERWIERINPAFLYRLKHHQFPGNKGHLYTLTNFDEGTIRWLTTYAGAWKRPKRWSDWDIFWDDLPNVPGIGTSEQLWDEAPFLGREWFINCALVAKNMFEAKRSLGGEPQPPGGCLTPWLPGLIRPLSHTSRVNRDQQPQRGIRYLMEKMPDLQNLTGPVDITYEELVYPDDVISDLSSDGIVNDAVSYLGTCLNDGYDRLLWLRIKIPRANDLDDGDGWFNVNNEEWGGTSDYWVMFIFDGQEDKPYTEAEYVDEAHPRTMWGVFKPLWERRIVGVAIKMFESDPTNHKDEHMDIRPGDGVDLSLWFSFQGDKLQLIQFPEGINYQPLVVMSELNGFHIVSRGEGDLAAQVGVDVWVMTDKKIEFIVETGTGRDDGTKAPVSVEAWHLDKPDYEDFQMTDEKEKVNRNIDLFTFDPGNLSEEQFRRLTLRLRVGRGDSWFLKSIYVRFGDVTKGREVNTWLNNTTLTIY